MARQDGGLEVVTAWDFSRHYKNGLCKGFSAFIFYILQKFPLIWENCNRSESLLQLYPLKVKFTWCHIQWLSNQLFETYRMDQDEVGKIVEEVFPVYPYK